jgi:hypothetical protein
MRTDVRDRLVRPGEALVRPEHGDAVGLQSRGKCLGVAHDLRHVGLAEGQEFGRGRRYPTLKFNAGRAKLTKTGGNDDGTWNATFAALANDIGNRRCRGTDHCEIHGFRQRRHIWVCLDTKYT